MGTKRCEGDGAAGMDLDVDLVSRAEAGQLEKGGIEDNAVRIADFGDGFDHA